MTNQEAATIIKKIMDDYGSHGLMPDAEVAFTLAIAALSSSMHAWTPCAYKLPTKDGAYDVTVKSAFGKPVLLPGYFRAGEWANCAYAEHIIAWKPRQDPYDPDEFVKVCPRCSAMAHYEPYFRSVICRQCGWTQDVDQNRSVE